MGTLSFSYAAAPDCAAADAEVLLCYVQATEFGTEAEFCTTPGNIGAYPTWDNSWHERYRPTNDLCLMRDMQSDVLCPVCKEELWRRLLTRASLAGGIDVSKDDGNIVASIRCPALLGQLREGGDVPGLEDHLDISWELAGRRQKGFDGQ